MTETDEKAGPAPDGPPPTPRWVKIAGIIALVLVLLLVAVFAFGGGEHGPGRHGSFGGGGDGEAGDDNHTAPGGHGGNHARSIDSVGPLDG